MWIVVRTASSCSCNDSVFDKVATEHSLDTLISWYMAVMVKNESVALRMQ